MSISTPLGDDINYETTVKETIPRRSSKRQFVEKGIHTGTRWREIRKGAAEPLSVGKLTVSGTDKEAKTTAAYT